MWWCPQLVLLVVVVVVVVEVSGARQDRKRERQRLIPIPRGEEEVCAAAGPCRKSCHVNLPPLCVQSKTKQSK